MLKKIIKVTAPGSKSLSHRALICAALAEGSSEIRGVLESDDIERTINVLSNCGAVISRTNSGVYSVQGMGGAPKFLQSSTDRPTDCNMGESGTSCRVLTSILAAGQGIFHIHGEGRLHSRPLGELLAVLRGLGAEIECLEKEGMPPLKLKAKGLSAACLPGQQASISCTESSQYLSGLLLAAPLNEGLNILLDGEKSVSWPYVSLTLQSMEQFGVTPQVEELHPDGSWREIPWREINNPVPGRLRFKINAGKYLPGQHQVEADWSGASYLLAAGAIGPNPVTVAGLNQNSLQGDRAILEILGRMGAEIHWEQGRVTVSPQPLRGIEVDMGDCPDLVPTVLVVAAHAIGATIIRNVAHLRIKESDRMQAPATELRKIGCAVMTMPDSIVLAPPQAGVLPPDKDTVFSAHNDHRLAMSLSLLGLPAYSPMTNSRLPGFTVKLDQPDCVKKSFPHFWDIWKKITG